MPYPPLMMLSIQKSPTAKQIQPMGLWGRLEAIRAPTKGKARKGTIKTNTMLKPPVPQVIGGCADRGRMMYNATFATNMISERVASDQASHAAVRALIPPIPRPCSLAPTVTAPLYSTTVYQALRGGNLWSNINLPTFLAAAFFAPSATAIPGGVVRRTRMRERFASTLG
jgi:hypothetical protein